jgi:hypothetical protein
MNTMLASLIVACFFGTPQGSALSATPQESEVTWESQADGRSPDASVELGSCPGEGSCCVAHGGPGCDNTACCESVCSAEPYCCYGSWYADCASLAQTLCGSVCGGGCPGEGDCC